MKVFLKIVAGVVLIPALLLMANFTWFAFVGAGFLPEATEAMQTSRVVIAWLSASISILLLGLSAH